MTTNNENNDEAISDNWKNDQNGSDHTTPLIEGSPNRDKSTPMSFCNDTTRETTTSDSSSYLHHEEVDPTSSCEMSKTLIQRLVDALADESGSAVSVLSVFAVLLCAGFVLGVLAAVCSGDYQDITATFSSCIGYTYFLCWSVSFYPQVVVNYRSSSTAGLSPDFLVLNTVGFACYTIYNITMYASPAIHDIYRQRYGPDANVTVQSNDIAFALHAFLLSTIALAQKVFYDGLSCCGDAGSRTTTINPDTYISRWTVAGVTFMFVSAVVYPLAIAFQPTVLKSILEFFEALSGDLGITVDIESSYECNWLDYLYILSYFKIAITLSKYIPQLIMNARRKSTVGFSIQQFWMDFEGGSLSTLQLIFDCARESNWSGLAGNLPKFCLGSASMVFDLIFFFQHYFLYNYHHELTATEPRNVMNEETTEPNNTLI